MQTITDELTLQGVLAQLDEDHALTLYFNQFKSSVHFVGACARKSTIFLDHRNAIDGLRTGTARVVMSPLYEAMAAGYETPLQDPYCFECGRPLWDHAPRKPREP